MSTQIAVRLPEALVEILDREVATGRAPSRASVVRTALERELRRRAAEEDLARLRATGPADDLDPLVAWSTSLAVTETD